MNKTQTLHQPIDRFFTAVLSCELLCCKMSNWNQSKIAVAAETSVCRLPGELTAALV